MPTPDLGAKLDVLIRIAAVQMVGERTGADAIALLGRAGLENELISELVGTTPATVRATLSRTRRKEGASRMQTKPRKQEAS